ncbi:MAG: Hsp70 family protein [Myxococcota bacterium]
MTHYIGLDFGTTNSALAIVEGNTRDTRLAHFQSRRGSQASFRSVLYFEPDMTNDRGIPEPMAGPQAIEMYLDEDDGEGRLIQAMKTYLVSRLFRSTSVYGTAMTLEDLIALLVGDLKAEAEAQLGALGREVVVGRPVHLSPNGDLDEDAFAIARLERAIARVGFDRITFEYEPVAAAYHYERRLDHDELVLIADFGGGTSDFTLIQVGPGAYGKGAERVLGTDGVPLAGNAFDSQLVKRLVAPALGLGSRYKTLFGKWMPIPPHLYADLQWHRLSMLRVGAALEDLEALRKTSDAPDRLDAFIHIIECNLGYHLYQAIERTKIALSSQEETVFRFVDGPVHLEHPVRRTQFERWIAEELDAISTCVDRLIAQTHVSFHDVDRVFMTGGSSFIPAVRRIFSERFGEQRLSAGDELTSVAQGLALRAADRAMVG